MICRCSGFCSSVDNDSVIVGYDADSRESRIPSFQKNVLPHLNRALGLIKTIIDYDNS